VFWVLTEEIFQDNLKVGMDFQSRVCAKFDVFFMRDYRYLIINEYTLLYYISMTCFLILFKSTALPPIVSYPARGQATRDLRYAVKTSLNSIEVLLT